MSRDAVGHELVLFIGIFWELQANVILMAVHFSLSVHSWNSHAIIIIIKGLTVCVCVCVSYGSFLYV